MKERYRISVLLSILLHIALLSYFVIVFNKDVLKTGETHVLHAYLYQNNLALQLRLPHQSSSHQLFKTKYLNRVKHADLLEKNQSRTSSSKRYENYFKKQKAVGNPNELLEILHNKIESHLAQGMVYGVRRVTVGFELFRDGHLTSIKILRSSGDSRLDDSVVKAVAAIQPIAVAKRYLQNKNYFKLSIIFQNE